MRGTFALLAATATMLFASAGTALAHNTLVDSDPAEGMLLSSGPAQIRLIFAEPVRTGYNTLSVIGPEGDRWATGTVRIEHNVVIVPVGDLGPAGIYTVRYRVLSDDGHLTTGRITFTLAESGGHAPAQPSEAAERTGSEGALVWPWIAGAAVLLAGGLALTPRPESPNAADDSSSGESTRER